MSVTIREKSSGAVLATAPDESDLAVKYEGNFYFDPSAVTPGVLVVTDRTYTCPHKGMCHWVDFQGENSGATVRDVAWVYQQPKPGHEAIQGRFGFYAGSRGGTRQD